MLEKVPIAFLAGLLSVVTPCVLPLVPGYLSSISAVEVDRLGERGVGRRIVTASVPFIVGFTVVFVLLGAGAAAVGSAVDKPTQLKIAGFVLVVLGLAFLGLLPSPERAVAPGLLRHARRRGSNALLGGAMFFHQRRVFAAVNLRVRKNWSGLIFYFLFYQYMMSPISLAGYTLETFRARRAW